MQQKDSKLINRITNKDKDAFKIVFNNYFKSLCGYANKYLDEFEVAKEIVQEVLKFWENAIILHPIPL